MPKEAQEFLEVHGGGTEDGVDGIALRPFEPVAFKPMFALEVAIVGSTAARRFIHRQSGRGVEPRRRLSTCTVSGPE